MTYKPISIDMTGRTFAAAQMQLEQAYFRNVLVATRYNRAAAAKHAGMSYSNFRARLSRLEIEGV